MRFVFATCISIYCIQAAFQSLAEERFNNISRNINSTPPTSILPFSPAITGTDNEALSISNKNNILGAKARLLSFGYEVGSLDGRNSAKFIAAIFRFQRARQIETTGSLNKETIALLYGTSK